jgi:uncharacterized protein YjbJ (UPF0337 family)
VNIDIAQGQWRQMKGKIQEKWGKLSDDDIDQIDGKAERFCGIVQERYGLSRDQAEKEFDRLTH